MAVLEADEIVYVARSKTTRRLMSVDLNVGSRLPAYCTSLGRVLLAALAARGAQAIPRARAARAPHAAHRDRRASTCARSSRTRARTAIRSWTKSWRSAFARSRSPSSIRAGDVIAAINASSQASRLPLARIPADFPARRCARPHRSCTSMSEAFICDAVRTPFGRYARRPLLGPHRRPRARFRSRSS